MRICECVELPRAKGQQRFPIVDACAFRDTSRPRVIYMHSSMGSTEPKSAVHYWLDLSAGLAYITVGVRFNAFRHFLDAIDTLIANPAWQPGTPVLEDLRDCDWTPPPPAIEEWRAYVARRQPMLN